MTQTRFPTATVLLSSATLLTSICVAVKTEGYPWSTVKITNFDKYGGLTHELLQNGEWWRVVTSQLVHVKQGHMLLNVVLLFVISLFVERTAGAVRLLLAWLVGGGIGTYASTLFRVHPPWNIGTGASQAIMSIAAFGVGLSWKGYPTARWVKISLAVAIAANIILDLIFAGHPKPGKIVGFAAGFFLVLVSVQSKKTPLASAAQL